MKLPVTMSSTCKAELIFRRLSCDDTSIEDNNAVVKEWERQLKNDFEGFRLIPKTVIKRNSWWERYDLKKVTVQVPVKIYIEEKLYEGKDALVVEYGDGKMWTLAEDHGGDYSTLLEDVVKRIKSHIDCYKL